MEKWKDMTPKEKKNTKIVAGILIIGAIVWGIGSLISGGSSKSNAPVSSNTVKTTSGIISGCNKIGNMEQGVVKNDCQQTYVNVTALDDYMDNYENNHTEYQINAMGNKLWFEDYQNHSVEWRVTVKDANRDIITAKCVCGGSWLNIGIVPPSGEYNNDKLLTAISPGTGLLVKGRVIGNSCTGSGQPPDECPDYASPILIEAKSVAVY